MDFKFWFRVDVQGDDDCWIFMNQPSQLYGVYNLKVRGKWRAIRTHRYAWKQLNGQIPNGLFICHSCDNGKCCNPNHLWLGTNGENQLDSIAKGRSGFRPPQSKLGEEHHSAKLKEWQVIEIRERYKVGGISQDKLAAEYSVNQNAISKIILRRSWKNI